MVGAFGALVDDGIKNFGLYQVRAVGETDIDEVGGRLGNLPVFAYTGYQVQFGPNVLVFHIS